MSTSDWIRRLRPHLAERPELKRGLQRADEAVGRVRHTVAQYVPAVVRPEPRQLTVAVTAACNLRCLGCRYGRDFMVGERLPLELALPMLDDAYEAGVNRVRLYGGEPLLHPDLPAIVRHSTELGMDTYATTNGTLLAERFDPLYEAGMRWFTVGFYGVGEDYAAYTQRPGHYERLVRGLDHVRQRYGDEVGMQLNFVLVRPTTSLAALERAWAFAERFGMHFHVDLYGYSVPFFTDGPAGEIPFREEDRPLVEQVAAELLRLKRAHPGRFPQSEALLRSIPDWLILGPDMRVPCDAYQLVWIGADGSIQLCDVAFPLGNLHRERLRDVLGGHAHRRACRDAFALRCPNCTCKSDSRIKKHAASWRRYRA